jgi:hypothetical protein
MAKEKSGNGNGSSSIAKDALIGRVDEKGTLPITDIVEASIVAMFFTQKMGKASLSQIHDKITDMAGEIDKDLLEQALEALRARGLLSYARGKVAGEGSVRMYKPKQILWAAPPEVAHLAELLPALVATPEAQKLISAMNAGEKIGEGEKKSKRGLGYDMYTGVDATFITLDHFLGSQPSSPCLDRLVRESQWNNIKEADLRFWRDSSGALVIGADAVKGWLRTGLRTAGYGDSIVSYIAASPVKIRPKRALQQVALPVVDLRQGGGKGLTSYEVLQPGERFTIHFRIPTRGFMSTDQFRYWLMAYAPHPIRGLSPARGGRFGRMAMIGYRVVGELRSAKNMLDGVMDDIPDEAKEFYAAAMAELVKKDVPMRKGCTKA